MTLPSREQVLAEPPGLRLDRWVAEAMGWKVLARRYAFVEKAMDADAYPIVFVGARKSPHIAGRLVVFRCEDDVVRRDWKNWRPSEDIAAAWELMEWLRDEGYEPDLEGGEIQDPWHVRLQIFEDQPDGSARLACVPGWTAPVAICRAFLLARLTEATRG